MKKVQFLMITLLTLGSAVQAADGGRPAKVYPKGWHGDVVAVRAEMPGNNGNQEATASLHQALKDRNFDAVKKAIAEGANPLTLLFTGTNVEKKQNAFDILNGFGRSESSNLFKSQVAPLLDEVAPVGDHGKRTYIGAITE